MNANTNARSGALSKSAYFLLRLNPPRPTFPADMSPLEDKAMQEHSAYWAELSREGTAVVYGPVIDPEGSWGLALVRVSDESASRALAILDPVIVADLGFHYDVLPMARAFVTGASS